MMWCKKSNTGKTWIKKKIQANLSKQKSYIDVYRFTKLDAKKTIEFLLTV